jgi:plasmid stabilization system protein ParE
VRDRIKLEWAPSAVRDVEVILRDLAVDDGPAAAAEFHERLQQQTRLLARKDAVSGIVPELRETGLFAYRELAFAPYSLFFKLAPATLGIIGVIDRRRDVGSVLFRRQLEQAGG